MTKSGSGLYSQDITVGGTGVTATAGKTVVVHYTGWLPGGTQFDTSRDTGEPISFELGIRDVIAGWDEGPQGMKVGANASS